MLGLVQKHADSAVPAAEQHHHAALATLLGRLQLLSRFSQAAGGVEPAHRRVGGVESVERGEDPLDRTSGGHRHSVLDSRRRSMIR